MPPRKKKPAQSGPTPVDAIVHPDKRVNIPTSDAHDFVGPEVEAPKTLLYPRDPSLDPQLVWKGKDEQDRHDLEVDAPPIYIQEKIDPRVLIEDLRQTSAADEEEPELRLFETFDGLGELDYVDFYRHDANWSNRMILGDSLQVMASLAEREQLRGKVQMIYIDPPYGIKFGSNWQFSTRKRDVKDGRIEDISREAEQIKAFRDTWELGIHSYLSYLRDRLIVARDLLIESGSVFVQIGDENVHLVRAILEEVFGSDNFVAQIVFKKTSAVGSFAGGTVVLPSTADHLLWFSKEHTKLKYRPLFLTKNLDGPGGRAYRTVEEPSGLRRPARRSELEAGMADGRFLRASPMTSDMVRENKTTVFPVYLDGKKLLPGTKGWKTNPSGMQKLLQSNRLMTTGHSLAYVRYHDDFPAFPLTNLWTDTQSGSAMDKIYVVQTNTKVIERCVLLSSDPGDLVLDPTCGSGATAHVAEQHGRRWITIDSSRVAMTLARQRLMGARYPYYLLSDSVEGHTKEQELAAVSLPNAPAGNDIRHGFVYERVQHITLKSIANNPDIREGMSQEEIDAAIKRHADFEMLYDRPYVDKTKVRVSGPFTVESLSPHRSLAFADSAAYEEAPTAHAVEPESFEQTIIDNLFKAGVQNGRRNERLEFESVEPYAGRHVQAVGIRSGAEDGTPQRVAIAIGPQYGTVSPQIIKQAAKEAIAAPDVDLLCVLGFAFDPSAVGTTDDYLASDEGFANVAAERSMGRVPVLLVRMNADLLMGEDLKKTDKGNLFTVFGEPDVAITPQPDGKLIVEIKGVDVYDPTTGEVRSRDTDRIALWMIDTNYNDESFFVRHCYFTGGNDPYARLKKALKADIDEDAWASLYQTVSRPFERPETGRIAVKVINDYGDEVMKVFDADSAGRPLAN